MIDPEHTAAPWSVRDGHPFVVKADADNRWIATYAAKKDALLGAAGPDMLQALLEFISMFHPPAGSIGDEVIQNARAAIVKATGQRLT